MFLSSVVLLLAFFVVILYSAEVNLFPGFSEGFICCSVGILPCARLFLHSVYLYSLAEKLTLRLLTFVCLFLCFVLFFFFSFLFFPLEA